MSIPVIDFSPYNLGENGVSDEHLLDLSRQFKSSFTDIGFAYLQNTGITQEEVEHVLEISKTFFLQPDEMKLPFSRKHFTESNFHGWVGSEVESPNSSRPGDLKEAFNAVCTSDRWPSEAFRDSQLAFSQRCKELTLRTLRVMALSLGLGPDVFLQAHRHIGSERNSTSLRSLYYPAVSGEQVKEGQLRCGEHTDFGSITLVFQSQVGGLEVRGPSGDFISVPALDGAVLINIADLMQRWTTDRFVSAVHRVLLPPAGDARPRQSLAFFVQPDDDALITCCDGSDKYPAVKSADYVRGRINAFYTKK